MTANSLPGKLTEERCPECGGRIVYNGNYFCEYRYLPVGSCDWALSHLARKKADRELAIRLTGSTR